MATYREVKAFKVNIPFKFKIKFSLPELNILSNEFPATQVSYNNVGNLSQMELPLTPLFSAPVLTMFKPLPDTINITFVDNVTRDVAQAIQNFYMNNTKLPQGLVKSLSNSDRAGFIVYIDHLDNRGNVIKTDEFTVSLWTFADINLDVAKLIDYSQLTLKVL